MQEYFKNKGILQLPSVYLALLFLFMFSSCSTTVNIFHTLSDTEYTSPGYKNLLERWTKKGTIHRGLKTELLVTATYKTEEFRIGYTEEYSRIYRLDTQKSRVMMNDQIRAANEYDDFLVSAYAPDENRMDFSGNNSVWKAYLLKDGKFRLEPFEIRRVKKEGLLHEAFYPFITPWSATYIFRFQKRPRGCEKVELVITGTPGSTVLKWELQDQEKEKLV